MTPAEAAAAARPRIEGDREQEILDAALEVLAEVGYDRLTMDAVAQRAKASKATLYRRWNSKAKLVVESLARMKTTPEVPDTGDLRSDLMTAFCGMGGLTDHDTTSTFGAVVTAVTTDPEFAAEFREQVVGPKSRVSRTVFERARDRGRAARRARPRPRRPRPGRHRPAPRVRARRGAGRCAHRARHRPDHPAGCQAVGLRNVNSQGPARRTRAHQHT